MDVSVRESIATSAIRFSVQALQARIDYMGKFDESPWNEWLDCYKAVAQVKQAIAAEKQNELLARIAIGVECLENVGH